MSLELIDWILIAVYLLFTLAIAIRYSKRAGKNINEFFLGGRNLPWYIAGISMVATTFAADTPLAVTELVGNQGISGNWLWWNMLIGGMLTTFFFARLWRRANILTEVEFIELRYGGKPARFLRGFKAVYLGLFMNVLVLGWVNLALMSLLEVFFGLDFTGQLLVTGAAMLLVAVYSAMAGLMGVAVTDVVQFVIAMTGSIVLAVVVVNSEDVGGISGLQEKLGPENPVFDFFPNIGEGGAGIGQTLTITFGAFFAYIGLQWWGSWYPGAEPGGGGYVAQRMMSAKTERDSVFATLFFQVAHYCLRPWPWILVALSAIVLYSLDAFGDPALMAQILELKAEGMSETQVIQAISGLQAKLDADPQLAKILHYSFNTKLGYVYAMRDFLPAGLKGLLLVAFLAAYMSTISTQLNWGASFLINDLYRPFMRPEQSLSDQERDKHYVAASRIITLILMLVALGVTTQLSSISDVWKFLIECGAGLGLVLILRWFWWRINAWAEIVATAVPFLIFGVLRFIGGLESLIGMEDVAYWTSFPGSYFITLGGTTVAWILTAYLTTPEKEATLNRFYRRVEPGGAWGKVRDRLGLPDRSGQLPWLAVCWLAAVGMTYSMLFAVGKLLFGYWTPGLSWLLSSLLCGGILVGVIRKFKLFDGNAGNPDDE